MPPLWFLNHSTYFITFVCYGTRLPGETGAVDRCHNTYGGPRMPESRGLHAALRRGLRQAPYCMDSPRREVVLSALAEDCRFRGWTLLAAHVRSTHVHAVLDADASPEHVMNTFKRYASRALNRLGLDGRDCRRWARHGSTSYLWRKDEVTAVVRYVVSGQGEPMAVFEEPAR